MSTHDKIELPPLPLSRCGYYTGSDILEYARAAIEADRKRRGEPVAMIRHVHYQGIARSGLAQEPVMLDGAPTLPDGAMLYTAPQPAEPVVKESLTVPDSWKLVPVELTHNMMYAGVAEWLTRDDPEEDVQGIWEAMLKAAPKFGEEE